MGWKRNGVVSRRVIVNAGIEWQKVDDVERAKFLEFSLEFIEFAISGPLGTARCPLCVCAW